MLHWYALKIFYNKVFTWEGLLEDKGLETYLAVQKVQLKGAAHLAARRRLAEKTARKDMRYIEDGPVIYERKPLVTSLLFVKADSEEINEIQALLNEKDAFGRVKGFIYRSADKESYATISAREMEIFKLVVESGAGGLEFFADDDFTRFKKGSKVRVKEGPLKGAEGYIKRIRKDRRLLVCIEGVIAVATSYIPPENLDIIEEELCLQKEISSSEKPGSTT